MANDRTFSINARFNHEDVVFGLDPQRLSALEEHLTQGSARLFLSGLVANAYRVEDIRRTLVAAYGAVPFGEHAADRVGLLRARAGMRSSLFADHEDAESAAAVHAAIKVNGIGTYAPLATAIVTAALLGIDPDDANFSDEPADGDA